MKKATILALAAVACASPAILEARQSKCNSGVHIIVARGTFEPQGTGLQGAITSAILAKIPGSAVSDVVYPASPVDVKGSLASGVANAKQQLNDYYAACPNGKVVVMGYSQGASVIGDALSGGTTGVPGGDISVANAALPQNIGRNVIAVIQFGDYNRIKGQGTDDAPNACTASGPAPRTNNQAAMQFYANRLSEYCDSGDPVCCATGNNILAHLGYFNSDNANKIANYVAAKYTS